MSAATTDAAGPENAAGRGAGQRSRDFEPLTTRARILGLGSVFGKAFRDSRRTAIVLAVIGGLLVFVTAQQVVAEFDTPASRLAFARQLSALPVVLQGMLGEPIRIDTLGGFVSWRLFSFMPVMFGIWSVVALSGTLAGELQRGSLEVVAATPLARRRLAIEKVAAYVVVVALAVATLMAVTYASINGFANLPGDSVPLEAALGQGAWLFCAALVPGAAAFAVAPFVGRGGALGVGAATVIVSFIAAAYSDVVPVLKAIRGVSYIALTDNHRPLAGRWDWPSVGLLAVVVAALVVAGVAAFERRDLVVPSGGRIKVPALRLWLTGPFLRGIGERVPGAVLWGMGLALFGLILASSADEFVAQISKIPKVAEMVTRIFPKADIFSAAGFLQIAFFGEAIIIVGIAAAVFVAGWASDEGERRLEVILGAPLGRAGWALRSGLSVYGAVGIMTVLMAAGVGAGAAIQGSDALKPMAGVSILGLYAIALAGIGLAVGGMVRPSLAAPVTLILGLAFYLLDILGAILKLPDAILQLALNRHLGQPLIGSFDGPGIIACVALAAGGLAICAMGMRRRDIGR